MTEALSFRSLKTRTVQNRFNIIVGLLLLILAFSLVESLAAVKVMSGIRAYVGGEGLWSKGQKEALNSLVTYAFSLDETDYQKYLTYTHIPLGDREARLEMNNKNPDYRIVTDGFIRGGNSPEDVGDLTFLYRNFAKSSLMKPSVDAWVQGDADMQRLIQIGSQVHTLISAGQPTAEPARTAWTTERSTLIKNARDTDAKLTVLENRFSASLGEGSHRVGRFLVELSILTTGLLGLLTLVVGIRSARSIIKLDKQKTEFVSLASHQLRTPLTAMNWYSEALLSQAAGPTTKQQDEYLTELRDGGQRMAALISDLLKVSSLDLGTYHPDIKTVDMNKVLTTVISDLQPEIMKKDIRLTTAVDPMLPELTLDAAFLTGILQNLLSNSVKYTKTGGKVSIAILHQRQNLLLHVADTGMGIPEKQQSQIFSKLFRADNAQKVDANGTGLGLYIVRAMVRNMGGKIWFESIEHKGTDFYVRLPIQRKGRQKVRNI